MHANKRVQKSIRRLRFLQVATVCLVLCTVGVAVAGCAAPLTRGEEGTTTAAMPAVTTQATVDSEIETESAVGEQIEEIEFMTDAEHRLYVEFLNTGKSDCVLIRADDKVILIDTADDDDSLAIQNKLNGYGIDTIDYMIITHYDNDHVGAADDILRNYTVKTVYAPDYVRKSNDYNNMMTAADEVSGRTVFTKITQDVDLDFGYGKVWINATAMEEYLPGAELGSDKNNAGVLDENNYSLITVLTFGEATVVLPGDAEEARVQEWVPLFEAKMGGFTKGPKTFLKIPHHGVYDEETGVILKTVSPWNCVVCSDRATVDSTLEAGILTNSGATTYYTYNGTVLFASNGVDCAVRQDQP